MAYCMKNYSLGEAQQVFNGIMLGDGSICKQVRFARFQIGLSGANTISYLYEVRRMLYTMGVYCSEIYPKCVRTTTRGGYTFDLCSLYSKTSEIMLNERYRWYPVGKKEVPSDFNLTPVSLAHWFMGDGSSVYDTHGGQYIHVKISSMGFNENSIAILEHSLSKLGFSTGRNMHKETKEGSGIVISILQDSINQFMDTIEPHMLMPYLYKIKHNGARLRAEQRCGVV